jgi:acetyl-CoA acetyltransferase
MAAAAAEVALVGLGFSEMGKVFGRGAAVLAGDAIVDACVDAGVGLGEVDGLLTNAGVGEGIGLWLHRELGLRQLRLLSEMQGYGSSAGAMVATAAMAIAAGTASMVACVFADTPLSQQRGAGAAYAASGPQVPRGFGALPGAVGLFGANPYYALAARRHMETYGTTSEQFGHIAIAARQWAARNPLAQMRQPITLADHQASRMIADPLHLLDCCLVSNGAIAVLVTATDRAAHLAQPPVHLLGWAQAHPGYTLHRGSEFGLVSGAAQSGPAALKMAGVGVEDVDVRELYDCYTYTTLITLEDYGFCAKGEGGPFAASGAIDKGGSLPINTSGGHLSEGYIHGLNHIVEGVRQIRGTSTSQVTGAEVCLATSGLPVTTSALMLRRAS